MLPAAQRLPQARGLIDEGLYFVVHAPRQTGKTTTLKMLADELDGAGGRVALYVSCEAATVAGEDYGAAETQLLHVIRKASNTRGYPESWLPPASWPLAPAGLQLFDGLSTWATQCPVPIVLLFDEIDTLVGRSLISVLRQLRQGFDQRPEGFPAAVVLCGLRDVRDYKAASGGDPSRIGGPSPFNIAVESLRMSDFSRDEVAILYDQHTAETGQEFTTEAIDRVFAYTAGQPWLVNALAREITVNMGVRPPTPIIGRYVDEAKERLIAARTTHLDSLAAKLAEPRVRRVMEPLLSGGLPETSDVEYEDDLTYVRDLGLIGMGRPRSFLMPDGRIDLDKLLREFVAFWREQGELMSTGKGYEEAGAQLVLLGYLYRVVNGGGWVDSEYGLGRRRVDVLIRKPYTGADGRPAVQREALELKVWADGDRDPVDAGLDQLDSYLASLGLETGVLVIFDRRRHAAPVAERGVFTGEVTAEGRKVVLLRA
jgi:hypothetical protein